MEVLAFLVVMSFILTGFDRLFGDDGRSYDEYRRVEYRNEYSWETRQYDQSLYDQAEFYHL